MVHVRASGSESRNREKLTEKLTLKLLNSAFSVITEIRAHGDEPSSSRPKTSNHAVVYHRATLWIPRNHQRR